MITFLALSLASAHGAAASLAMDGYFGRTLLQAPAPAPAAAPATVVAATVDTDPFMTDSEPFDAAESPDDTSNLPPGVQIFEEEDLDRGPCAPSSITGFVCQKAHVNGTLRIHWTPFTVGDTVAHMAVELIGRTVGWVGLAWTEIPTNMVGSQAIIVTDSIEGGIGVFELSAKAVSGILPISGTEAGFQVNNLTVIRDQANARTVGTFTRTFDNGFAGDQIYRMIGAAGATNELVYHNDRRRAFRWSLSSPPPDDSVTTNVVLPPGVSAPPGAFSPATPSIGTPVSNPAVADDGTPLPPGTPPPASNTAAAPDANSTDTTTGTDTTATGTDATAPSTDATATGTDATVTGTDATREIGAVDQTGAETAEAPVSTVDSAGFGMLAGVSAACLALGASLLA